MKLSFGEKFGYGLGDTASNFVWALMMNFIMYYYTDIFGRWPGWGRSFRSSAQRAAATSG
jgi:Na+/melibiose symporter-like transporter